jgi:hypothetical protein
MASIASATFDQASYSPGATATLVVEYTADVAGSNPVTHTATITITDSTGAVTATAEAPLVVNVPVAGGDVVAVSDDASDTYVLVSDTGSVATFTTTVPSS